MLVRAYAETVQFFRQRGRSDDQREAFAQEPNVRESLNETRPPPCGWISWEIRLS
jgi:hypothetical protein